MIDLKLIPYQRRRLVTMIDFEQTSKKLDLYLFTFLLQAVVSEKEDRREEQ